LNILLVRTPRVKQSITLGEAMFCEPIGLEMVYAVLKDKHHVEIIDLMIKGENYKEKLAQFQPDIVGITSLCIDVKNVIGIAEETKVFNSKIKVFVGGTQSYLQPESFFNINIDYVFKYTTRENLNYVVDNINNLNLDLCDGVHIKLKGYRTTNIFGRNEYIIPDRASTEKHRAHYSYLGYKPCAIMQTSFGCSKQCNFCLRWRIEGAVEQNLELVHIADEIENIKENNIMIFDNDFLYDQERINELCDLLEERKINKTFICYSSVNSILKNKDAIKNFKRLGLSAVLVGYESFREEDMKNYKKESTIEDNIIASRLLKEMNIDCWASFILHPDWDKKDFSTLKRYIKKLKPEISTFSPLTPFIGLPYYEEYKNRLIHNADEYEKWSFGQVIIHPSKLTLRQYYIEMFKLILYTNIVLNSSKYMLKCFGIATYFRLAKGAFKIMPNYIKLILQSNELERKTNDEKD